MTDHVPASQILVLVSQQTLSAPYREVLRDPQLPGAGAVDITTTSGLALRMIDLFWPARADKIGFRHPQRRPIFLNIETTQYYLHQAIAPLLQQGYFDPNVVPVTITLTRLMSQILDNLNKAALLGLPHTEVGEHLADSLALESSSRVALEHTQACVNQFRDFCLKRNLLDFSLRIETFYQHLWPNPGVRAYLTDRYRHLIVDNLEEDNSFSHTILGEWLPDTESALVVHDEDAGYRIFLGANWRTAKAIKKTCDKTKTMGRSRVASKDMKALGEQLSHFLSQPTKQGKKNNRKSKIVNRKSSGKSADPRNAMEFHQLRFYPQMVEWVIDRIAQLIDEGTSPNDIVVLAPFVSDALRFSFQNRMKQRNLPARAHRPSRPLSEEPAAKTLLTLTRLAFPKWNLLPEPFDVAQALHQAIADLDLVRANLLCQVVYRQYEREAGVLTAFDEIEGDVRERISYQAGNKFDALREWLLAVQSDPQPPVLDHFFSRLFGEILSQPGFGFHGEQESGEIIANLIDSARKFRRVAEQVPLGDLFAGTPQFPSVDELNKAYLHTIEQGIMAAQYIRGWDPAPEESVLITPATTFLMSNRPVTYQFWLDAGSNGWWERIAQPLTHPYILAADWKRGRPWTDEDEVQAQRDRLYRLILGLTRRCREKIFIVNAEISEQGFEQRGQLLVLLQQMLRQMQREER